MRYNAVQRDAMRSDAVQCGARCIVVAAELGLHTAHTKRKHAVGAAACCMHGWLVWPHAGLGVVLFSHNTQKSKPYSGSFCCSCFLSVFLFCLLVSGKLGGDCFLKTNRYHPDGLIQTMWCPLSIIEGCWFLLVLYSHVWRGFRPCRSANDSIFDRFGFRPF